MESIVNNRGLLRDLALIYIALAHSTDQKLSNREVDAIAERLRAWRKDVKSETVLSALKEAMEDYTEDTAHEQLDRAVASVKEAVPLDLRQFILDDMMEIAMCDDKFLFKESSFIGELAREWEISLSEQDEQQPSWSLLSGTSGHTNWTPIHDLALIYLTLAHQTDEDLSVTEMEIISHKLGEWVPAASEDHLLGLVREALSVYVQGPDERVFSESVEAVKKCVPAHQLPALLTDLRTVAEADGQMLDAEQHLITRLARAWDTTVAA